MKFLRTIRFDESDDHVFERAASPDEWAVSGAFAFADLAPETVTGKLKQAFSNGFLGLESFGRSTFSVASELDEDVLEQIHATLTQHFVEHYGAPDIKAARPAALEETRFIMDLCSDALVNTVFTVSRRFDENAEVREEFRTIQAPGDKPLHTRIWSVVEDDG